MNPPPAIEFAELQLTDYDAVIALWRNSENVGLSGADSRASIAAYLVRNPGMSFVARDGDRVVGAALCGHDGRRGFIHHLAVDRMWRGEGIGRKLVDHCLTALQAAGNQKCHIFIFKQNSDGIQFWQQVDWVQRPELIVMSKQIMSSS